MTFNVTSVQPITCGTAYATRPKNYDREQSVVGQGKGEPIGYGYSRTCWRALPRDGDGRGALGTPRPPSLFLAGHSVGGGAYW